MKIKTLLLDLLREPDKIKPAVLGALTADEWVALVTSAHEHRCGPYLADILSGLPDIEVPPVLLRLRKKSLFRNLKVGRECAKIHEILSDAGIRHLFLKGVPLAFRDYPEPWMRPMRDIDVLVDPGRLDEAYKLLVKVGGVIDKFAHKPVGVFEGGKHLPPIHSPNRILPVELHYAVVSSELLLSPQAFSVIEREIWTSAATVNVGGAALPVPSAEMLLVHLLIHGLYDHELNNGPLFFTDLIHLIRTNVIDRYRLNELVEQTGIIHAVKLAASLLPPAEKEVLCPGPAKEDLLSSDALTSLLLQSSGERTELKLMATLSASTLRERAAIFSRKLLPDATTLRTRWNLEGGKAGSEPQHGLFLWLWFIATRGRSFLRLKAKTPDLAKASLLSLRSALAGRPDAR